MAKKNWIKSAIKRPGAFKAKAKKAGKSTDAFKKSVLKNPEQYDTRTVRQANLANTLAKFQGGGTAYALPTSTSTLASLPNAEQSKAELQELEAQSRRARRMNARADKLEQQQAEQQSQEQFQAARDQYGTAATKGLGQAIGTVGDTMRAARYAQDAARMTNGVTDTAGLLSNLSQAPITPVARQGLQGLGQGLSAGVKAMGPGAGGAVLGLAGAGVKRLSDDNNATKLNAGEMTGSLMQGAGTGLGLVGTLGALAPALAIPGIGWAAAGLGAGVAGVKALVNRDKARKEQEEMDAQEALAQQEFAEASDRAFSQGFTQTGSNLGFNVGNSMTNSYLPSQQLMANGGLWANIHAKRKRIAAGSGEKMRAPGSKGAPTDEALKRSQKEMGGERVPGGMIKSLPGGAVEFVGQTHAQGGIMIDPQTEVENKETMDQVKMSDGDMSDYVFSEHLKLGGKSFAQRHKEILKRGGSQKEIQRLAALQEKMAAKEGKDENGPRDPNMIAKMQGGGELEYLSNNINFGEEGPLSPEDPNDPNFTLDRSAANLNSLPPTQSKNELGLYSDINKTDYEILKARNPWFNWGEGDLPAEGEIERFQTEFKAITGRDIRIDDMLGEQTASAYIPYKRNQAAEVVADSPKGEGEETEAGTSNTETTAPPHTQPRGKRGSLAPLASLLGLAQLPKRLDTPPRAARINPQTTGEIRLPRVNYNAERAAGAASTTAVNRAIEGNIGGPGKVAAMLASTNQQRQNNIQIAQAESMANKQLMTQEALANANINQQNAANVMGAQQFNEQSRYGRDMENYQQKILRDQAVGDTIAGIGRDYMAYRSDERMANAMDDTGAYLRFIQQNPDVVRKALGMGTETEAAKNAKAKYGGYIKKSNSVRRKKRK